MPKDDDDILLHAEAAVPFPNNSAFRSQSSVFRSSEDHHQDDGQNGCNELFDVSLSTDATTFSSTSEVEEDSIIATEDDDEDDYDDEDNHDEAGVVIVQEKKERKNRRACRGLRLQYFHRARSYRNRRYHQRAWGVFGLFMYVRDVRLDMEWAEEQAQRYQNDLPLVLWSDFDRNNGRVSIVGGSKNYRRQHHQNYQPLFAYLIIAMSTVMMVLSFYIDDWKVEPMSVNPMIGPSPQALLDLGALSTVGITEDGEWYRLFAPMVLHAGILHYIVNVLGIALLGCMVERVHGVWKTAIVFILAGMGGNTASAVFSPHTISVGASGGVFGILGLCLADVIANLDLVTIKSKNRNKNKSKSKNRTKSDNEGKVKRGDSPRLQQNGQRDGLSCGTVFWCLALEMFLIIVIGLTPYVDNFAHLGGLFYGTCVGFCMVKPLRATGFFGRVSKAQTSAIVMARVASALLAGAVWVGTLDILLQSDGIPSVCRECMHISCVPFPFWKPKDEQWWQCDVCDLTGATFKHTDKGKTELILACPFGETATVPDTDTDPSATVQELWEMVPDYCRRFCDV